MPRLQELSQDYLALSCVMLRLEGETAAVLHTFTQTCQALGIEPWRYLRDVLERLPSHPPERLAALQPEEWARAKRGAAEALVAEDSNETVPPPSG